MLNDNKYFNQDIIANDVVRNKLLQYIDGIDIKTIDELINQDIKEKHLNDETFYGTISMPDATIQYKYDFIQWNAFYVCEELAKKKFFGITINQGNTTVILAGTNTTLEARRKTPEQDNTLNVIFNAKEETMEIEENMNNKVHLNNAKVRTLKNNNL